jgi:hypothetical protein
MQPQSTFYDQMDCLVTMILLCGARLLSNHLVANDTAFSFIGSVSILPLEAASKLQRIKKNLRVAPI